MKYILSLDDIVNVTNGELICGNKETKCEDFKIDSRLIEKDNVFIGINGESFDGGKAYKNAFENGAIGVIVNDYIDIDFNQIKDFVDEANPANSKCFILKVKDTTKALGEIASFKRDKSNVPVVCVTGSVGKTSTKDIISSVLSTEYKVLRTEGNMNNNLGLPMTILGLKDEQVLVLEMGMNHLGEIHELSLIAKPNVAVITSVGTAHIGNLGSRENILKAKLEILDGIQKEIVLDNGLKIEGTLIINNDNDMLHDWKEDLVFTIKDYQIDLPDCRKYSIKTVGIKNDSDYMAKDIEYNENSSNYKVDNNVVEISVGGEAYVYNSLLGYAVGKIFNIKDDKIVKGIKDFVLTKNRLDIEESSKGYKIIDGTYNANYDSMLSSIDVLEKMKGKRRIIVVGDMLELGEFSEEIHTNLGKELVNKNIDIFLTVGEEIKYTAEVLKENKKEVYEFTNNEMAIKRLQDILQDGDIILIKASNSMRFKEIVDAIK